MSGDGESLVGVGSFVGTFGFVRPVDAFVARHVASNDDGHDDQGDKEKGQHSADHSLKGNAAPIELKESLLSQTLKGTKCACTYAGPLAWVIVGERLQNLPDRQRRCSREAG